MAASSVNRISVIFSLLGGLLATLELMFVGLIWNIWAWVTSGKQFTLDLPNLSFAEWFDPSTNPGPIGMLGIILWAFASGAGVVFFLSKRPLRSFIQDPSRSRGWPRTGLVTGFLSGLVSCTLFSSVTVLALLATEKSISSGLFLWTLLIYSAAAISFVGLPIGLIGGIAGSISELVLRRMYRSANLPATSPDK